MANFASDILKNIHKKLYLCDLTENDFTGHKTTVMKDNDSFL